MYSFISALILFSTASAFAGVTTDNFVVEPGQSVTGVARLERQQIKEDLHYLKAAVAAGYAGPEFSRRLGAVSLEETSSLGFCERLAAVFENVRDAHLRAGVEFRACGRRPAPGRVGANLAGATNQWLQKTIVRNGKTIEVLAIPKFLPRFDAGWNGFLDAVRTLRQSARPFVIDLRGNAGGDDSMGFELARILMGLEPFVNLPSPVESRRFRQTPEAFALQSNHWALNISRLRAEGAAVPPYMYQRRDEILSWMERAKNGQFPEQYVENLPESAFDQSKIFSPDLLVLVDRACASACETTLQVLENIPGRVLVGENTYGAVEFGDVGRLLLPHSRIVVSLATMNVKFRDGRRVEKSGYAPDLTVPEGADALEAALNRIVE